MAGRPRRTSRHRETRADVASFDLEREPKMSGESGGNYAEVNGLKMYYEIHGQGDPIVLLHGSYMTIGG